MEKMSTERVIEILDRNGVTITIEEAEFFTGFLNNISELVIKIDELKMTVLALPANSKKKLFASDHFSAIKTIIETLKQNMKKKSLLVLTIF